MKIQYNSALYIAVLALVLAGCQSTPQQQRQDNADAASAAGVDDMIAEPADRRTRAKAHTDLASAYFELGNMAIALDETRIALSADPSYAPAYNIQGLVRMDLRDTTGAEQSFQRGLQLSPDDPDINHNYGAFLCQTGKTAQSIPYFMNAIRNPLYQTPARSYAAAGQCSIKDKPEDAMAYFERALRLDPNSTSSLLPMAAMLYQRGQLTESRNLLTRYHKLIPDPTAESLWLGVRLERKLGNRAAEESYATQLRRRFVGSPEYQALAAGKYD